jgi:predicted aminopeptidase
VAGYSTLGFTADPIYSSMLEGQPARIVEVVLHEMLHGTLYLAGHSDWNESLATFVGIQGASLFFAARGSAAEAAEVLADAEQRKATEERFAAFLEPVARELEQLYASGLPRATVLERREPIFRRAEKRYLELFPPAPGQPPGAFVAQPLNNAVVMAYAVYHRATPEHRRLYQRVGGDLAAFIRLYRRVLDSELHPIEVLHRLAEESTARR